MSEPKSNLGKSLASKGKSVTDKMDKPTVPWTGPNGEGKNGGVTQGLIGRFLVCPMRLKVRVYDGLQPRDKFQANIEFGNFWHAGEEAYKLHPNKPNDWLEAILKYYDVLCNKYPMDRQEITHWYSLCREQFPIYIEFWEDHPEELSRTRLLSEQTFDVQYKLPSGRAVRLRGKWDGISLIQEDEPRAKLGGQYDYEKAIWLDENKSKSAVDHSKITRQLKFDLQTMTYLVVLKEEINRLDDSTIKMRCSYREGEYKHFYPIKGVRYNVVKRSAHKSADSMIKKIHEDIENGKSGEWFGRWNVPISEQDILTFKKNCLDPNLERMCIWWDILNGKSVDVIKYLFTPDPALGVLHYQYPYGVYNPMDHGGEDAVDEFLRTGSRVGLEQVRNLFPELQES